MLSQAEFERRFRESERTLWCIAAAVLGSRDRADDTLQEAAVIALSKLDQFDPDTSFTAWMGQIVRFTGLNQRRRAYTGSAAGAIDADRANPRAPEASPVDARGDLEPDQGSFDDRVVAALNELGETARSCLLLRVVRGLSYKEIARALDVPEGTAMSHVHRARAAMRSTLRAREREPTP